MAKQNKPAIRFKGFTDAWEQRKLGELVEIGDIDHRMPETVADGIPYLMTGDFCGTNELNFNSVKMISENDYRQLSQKIKPEQGDIIFARYASVGAARYVDFTRKFLISYSCAIIKQSKKIDSKYLYHFITSASAQKQIKIEINTGSQANIGIDSMKNNIIVDMPLPEEQRKIGIFLTQIDHLITLHQRKYDKLQVLKKALLEKMFPKNGSSVPEIRFKGFTDAWEQRKFSDITFPAGEKNKENLPLESYSITNESGFVPQDEKFENGGTMREADKRMYYIVSPNSFAYNPARINVGSIGYQDTGKSVIVSSLYEVFKTSDDVDDRLLWHWFKSPDFQKLIMQLQEGGVRLYFYYDKLCMGQVFLPSLEEQRKIGKLFDTLDHLITLHQRELEKLQNIKKSMLEKMFV